jgi:hypothetical protein
MTMTKMMILRGWQPTSIGSCRSHRKPAFPDRARRPPRDRRAGNVKVARRRHHLAVCVPIRLLPLLRVGSSCRRDLPKCLVWAIRSRLLGRGLCPRAAPPR